MASHFIPKDAITRESRAVDLAEIQGVIQHVKDSQYLVSSQWNPSKSYIVDLDKNECSCPDFLYRHLECKHLIATKSYMQKNQITQL